MNAQIQHSTGFASHERPAPFRQTPVRTNSADQIARRRREERSERERRRRDRRHERRAA